MKYNYLYCKKSIIINKTCNIAQHFLFSHNLSFHCVNPGLRIDPFFYLGKDI